MKQILNIRGTSSGITFELEDTVIRASGEFIARSGQIDGFSVSQGSLQYEDGRMLSDAEREELLARYADYILQPQHLKNWTLVFE